MAHLREFKEGCLEERKLELNVGSGKGVRKTGGAQDSR